MQHVKEYSIARRALALAVAVAALPAAAHLGDCTRVEGVRKARCERHQQMALKCSVLKGDAHFACDREFLLANPLKCDALAGADADACRGEVAAFRSCEPNAGVEFMRCVRKATGESPMGH